MISSTPGPTTVRPRTQPAAAPCASAPPRDAFTPNAAPPDPTRALRAMAQTAAAAPPTSGPSNVDVEVTYQYGSPVLSRSTAGNQLVAKDGETFEKWKSDLEKDPDHAPVLKEMLRELVTYHKMPQGIVFERFTLTDAEGHKYTRKLPTFGAGCIIFDRHKAKDTDGTVYYDYVRRGDPKNRLVGRGDLV